MLTQTGDDCLLMAQAHVAHDCILGDGVIMANAATLAGHVVIEDHIAPIQECISSVGSEKKPMLAATL